MARKSKKQRYQEVFDRAMRNFNKVFQAEQSQRQLSKEDMSFAQTEDGQWEDINNRNYPDRPRFTVNKIANALDIVQGNFIEIMPSIKVRAAGGGATKDDAEVRNGLIRYIQRNSNASDAYANAHWEVINGGRGGWKIRADYCDDDFVQDIYIDRICDATSSLWLDCNAKAQDKRDAMYGFYIERMDLDEYKLKYPKTAMASFDNQLELQKECDVNWFSDRTVSVAQYYEKIPTTKEIAQLTDGRVVEVEAIDRIKDELAEKGITIAKQRTVKTHKVVTYLMNGIEVIDGPYDVPCKFIPLIECLGITSVLEGKTYSRGLVRNAKDSQRVYNYALSRFVETTAMTPEQPYIIEAEQIDGYENEWARAAVDNPPFLRFKGNEYGTPQRAAAPQVSPALTAQMQTSESDVSNALGVFVAPKRVEGEASGRALAKMEQNSNLATTQITRNMQCAVQFTGDILNDMIPRIYDSERIVRVIGEDGVSEEVVINASEFDQESGEMVPVYDMSMGKYDLEADTGPAYATKKVETFEMLQNLTQNNPAMQEMYSDLIIRMMDTPSEIQDEMTRRARWKLIQTGMVQPSEEEMEEMAEQIQAAQMQQQQLQQAQMALYAQQEQSVAIKNAKTAAEVQKLMSDMDSDSVDRQKTFADIYKQNVEVAIQKQEAGLPVTEAEARTQIANTELWNDDQMENLQGAMARDTQRATQQATQPQSGMGQNLNAIAPQVQQAVQQARNSGMSDDQIMSGLADQGIPPEAIEQFLGA